MRDLKMRSIVASHRKLTMTNWKDHRSWSSYNYKRRYQGTQHLKQSEKMKKFNKWVPHELTETSKKIIILSSLILPKNNKPFIDQIVTCNKKCIFDDQLSGWTKKLQSTSQSQTCIKLTHGHCLVICCKSDQLQLSKPQGNHYVWEVCSADQWDTLKTETPVDGIAQ